MALARFQSMAQDNLGNVIVSPTVEVRRESDNALAALFSNRAGTTSLSNPFTGDADGLVAFHVAGGAYKVTVTKGGNSREFRYVGIGTNSEYDVGAAGVPEAPTDGVQYGRQSAAWTPVVATGGGTPSNSNPLMDGVAAPGVATAYSRGDHVHPSDTTRAPLASPTFTGDPKAPTPTPGDNDTSIATTAFVSAAVGTATVPPATVAPLMDGAAAVGTATKYAREDHVHPSDTAKQAADADLTAVAALSGTGIARRTSATPTWTVGTAVTNAELATMPAFTFKGNNSGGAAVPIDVDIAALTAKASPGGGDFLLLSDQAASGSWKKLAISNLPGAAGGIPEAPNDGLQYGRQSLGWTQITGGGGASPSNALPLVNGTANAGASALYSRGDHVHPIDTSRQAADAELTAIAGLTSAADQAPYFTGSGTAALMTVTAAARTVLDDTTVGAMLVTLGGQPSDAELTALAGLTSAANQLPYFTGAGTAALTPLTVFGRSLIDDADAAAAQATLGLTAAASATPSALTRTNDTNVTLTLGGTPTTALLQATSITVGWSGTLAASRGGFGADISAANGVPLFATGAATFTGTTGTGNFVRADSPTFTGDAKAVTAAPGDNDTSIATTAFVTAAVAAGGGAADPSLPHALTLIY